MRFYIRLLLLLALTGIAAPIAGAWGKTGHRVSAQIAEAYLDDNARAEIARILGVEDLAEASTWADFMRSNPDEFWQRTANPWHYVTIPPGKSYAEAGAPPQGDAITALAKFRSTLTDTGASLAERQLALRFTVHLVADLHQPLHAGNGRDRGGNRVTVVYEDEPINLHSLWDTTLVDEQQLCYRELTAWLLRRLTPETVAGWQQIDPVVWVTESAAIRETIYPGDNREIRWNYIYQHRDTVNERLSQAGVRMAAYLNALFAEASAN